MKNFKLYILLLAVSLGFSSCDDYLDVTPKGKVIPTKTNDYRLLLDSRNIDGVVYGQDLIMMCSDDVIIPDKLGNPGAGYQPSNLDAFKFKDHIFQTAEEDHNFQTLYKTIYLANLVLDEVMGSDGEKSEKDQLYAEALVHRAFSNLMLVNQYGKHYNPASANSDLGIYLRKGISLEENDLSRNSVAEVYESVESDLMEALELNLPDQPEINHRPSKAAVYGILSRMYLYMNNITDALKYADMSIALQGDLRDYNVQGGALRSDLNQEVILHKTNHPWSSLLVLNPELQMKYNPANLRFGTMFMPGFFVQITEMLYVEHLFVGESGEVGITLPEMFYTKAECLARQNKANEAIDVVNTVRKTRIMTSAYADLSAADADEALTIVKEERRKELVFRGLRWFDLKRYNQFDNASISVTHTLLGQDYTLEPNANKWALPIARKYILKNPEIQQNPR